ncbi:YceI family protein [Speluncibacter jeojiensis]|uniref:YceI family protein n=1 Tax=Speluncibacter jeojiensis TaxID=2710754 RepID=A0A9X4RC06_9ACTN|nr:YceI family protein [Corynebacteriales bacterium D3-21]
MTGTDPAQQEQAHAELSGDYDIDVAHSRFGFMARHAMVTRVHGTFNDVDGVLHLDAGDLGRSTARVTLVADSIDTGVEQRDQHLRSNDFFDMPTYPEITFVSTAINGSAPSFEVTGDLTVKGITKPVTVDVEFTGAAVDPSGNHRVGFEVSGTLNRRDWGVNWNAAMEAGGMLVGDKVTLEIDISAIRRQE